MISTFDHMLYTFVLYSPNYIPYEIVLSLCTLHDIRYTVKYIQHKESNTRYAIYTILYAP